MVRLKSAATSMFSVPPGMLTVTGLFTSPRRTAALAAARATSYVAAQRRRAFTATA